MVGELLKRWRKKKGLSLVEVAKMIGTKKGTISNWENGRRYPAPEYWEKIEKITNGAITVQTLLQFFEAQKRGGKARRKKS